MKLVPVILALSLFPVVALAADPPRQPESAKEFEARFSQADTDKSGGLSMQEAERAVAPGLPVVLKNFAAMDVNKDGQVTLLERNAALENAAKARQAQQAKRMEDERKSWEAQFAKADSNKDGALSKKEAESAAAPGFPQIKKNFTAMDKDKNGKVTIAERDDFLKAEIKAQIEARQAKARRAYEDLFARADANKSGGLSKKEVDSAVAPGFPIIKNNFDDMDADRNGQVTIQERDAFLKRKR